MSKSYFCLAALLVGVSFNAQSQTAADTARIAAASGYLETGGLKVGMSLKDLGAATRALNPRFQMTNTKVTVWPYDPANTTAPPPPDAPVSVESLSLQTPQNGSSVETVNVTLALYPNMPVVTKLDRSISYVAGAGPNYTQVLAAMRAKLGPETETIVTSDSAQLRMMTLRWYFDVKGKLVPHIAPFSPPPCGDPRGKCEDRSTLEFTISASGAGVVQSMGYVASNGALIRSALEATDGYLQFVADQRTQKQNKESTGRALPKL